MILVIAEKPSVSGSLSKVIGAANRKKGYFEGNGYLVSWCLATWQNMWNLRSMTKSMNVGTMRICPSSRIIGSLRWQRQKRNSLSYFPS